MLYVHIPFCVRKCSYCDFLSFAGAESYYEPYLQALCRDILSYRGKERRSLSSIFIGGGTPSLMPLGFYTKLFAAIQSAFTLFEDCEITIEANPGTLTREKLLEYRSVGMNRLSIGLQSCHDRELCELGRLHTYQEFLESYQLARELGFDNINVDLMMAFPGQTEESHAESLRKIIALSPEHISAYGLIVEPGTPYEIRYEKHPEEFPGEDMQCTLYRNTISVLASAGYLQYEISNFSKDGYACRHNIGYWLRREYIGIGIGAASFYNGRRCTVGEKLDAYLVRQDFSQDEAVSEAEALEETIMLSLRTTDGLQLAAFAKCFGTKEAERIQCICERFVSQGWMRHTNDRFYFTTEGFLVSNTLIAELLP